MDGGLSDVDVESLSWMGFFFYGLLNVETAIATKMHFNRLKWKAGWVIDPVRQPFSFNSNGFTFNFCRFTFNFRLFTFNFDVRLISHFQLRYITFNFHCLFSSLVTAPNQ